ncbi:MAG: acyl-CoA thioesterase [Planctomycetaceae bacterium]|nr:acyl-CoA thioesterase [Planctomycetaceae bacterium]
MPQFIATRRVEFSETDMAGIVHFANFYRWMEEAEGEYRRSLGLSIMEPREDGSYLGWPRVSASCSFERPLTYLDVVQLRLDVERIGVKSVSFYIEFWKADQRVAYGRIKTACCICRPNAPLESVAIPEYQLAVLHESEELLRNRVERRESEEA